MMARSKGRENATIEPFEAVAVFFIFSAPGHRVRFYKSQLSWQLHSSAESWALGVSLAFIRWVLSSGRFINIHPLSLEALGVSSTFIRRILKHSAFHQHSSAQPWSTGRFISIQPLTLEALGVSSTFIRRDLKHWAFDQLTSSPSNTSGCRLSLAVALVLWRVAVVMEHSPDANRKIQTHKRLKRTLFIRTKHNMRMFGVIPFIKLQNDTSTTVKGWKTMKNETES